MSKLIIIHRWLLCKQKKLDHSRVVFECIQLTFLFLKHYFISSCLMEINTRLKLKTFVHTHNTHKSDYLVRNYSRWAPTNEMTYPSKGMVDKKEINQACYLFSQYNYIRKISNFCFLNISCLRHD